MTNNQVLHIIGGGLAGCEAAWTAAQAGIDVVLHEMRPKTATPAHTSDLLAELVCSNSFRSDDAENNAVGLLHAEMRMAGSLILSSADENQVPAGSALAVDRRGFAARVTEKITSHPLIRVEREEVKSLPPAEWGDTIIATGPLTAPDLATAVQQATGTKALSFYDAIAPIVYKDSVDMSICWYQSRYDKIGPKGSNNDYINCPMNREEYTDFIHALLSGQKAEFRSFEEARYFDGCLPIEVMAERGHDTLRHGPMKPRGLTNAHHPDIKPYAVVQLRQDNALGTLYNMVGFQTKLKYQEQVRIFRSIPGLKNAEFARLGGLHRNTYLNSPLLLDRFLRLRALPNIRFAGQITGCEGYVESAAIGLLAGLFAVAQRQQRPMVPPPITSAMGALLNHITVGHVVDDQDKAVRSFQPMNINFGLFPPLTDSELTRQATQGNQRTATRKQLLSIRALRDFKHWLNTEGATR